MKRKFGVGSGMLCVTGEKSTKFRSCYLPSAESATKLLLNTERRRVSVTGVNGAFQTAVTPKQLLCLSFADHA